MFWLILCNLFGVISHLFKYKESQYLSYLPNNLLSKVICGLHVKGFGHPPTTYLK
jgi:hypothetical protein